MEGNSTSEATAQLLALYFSELLNNNIEKRTGLLLVHIERIDLGVDRFIDLLVWDLIH